MTSKGHLTEGAIIDFITWGEEYHLHALAKRHLEDCDVCAAQARSYREMVGALRGDDIPRNRVSFADQATAAWMKDLTELSGALERESAEAEERVNRLLTLPNAKRREQVTQSGFAAPTRAFVERLLDEVHSRLESNPKESLDLIELAELACSRLPDEPDLLGDVLKDRANVLRYLGRPTEAHRALDRAEELYRKLSLETIELASVNYVRATLCWNERNFDRALELAREAAIVFQDFGEKRKRQSCRVLEAGVLFERSDYSTAKRSIQELLKDRSLAQDIHLHVQLLINLGHCEAHLGQLQAASMAYSAALQAATGAGLDATRASIVWSLADIESQADHAERASDLYERAESEFRRLGMIGEAATVLLGRAEAALRADRTAEAIDLCRQAIRELEAAGVPKRIAEALAYLQDALRRTPVKSTDVSAVRHFVAAARSNPESTFLAPEA